MDKFYTRKNVLIGELVKFTRVSEEFMEGEDDTPSCEQCGGPLHTEDEVFSSECDGCFKKFIEADLPIPTTKDH